ATNNGAPAWPGRASASPSGLPAATPAVEPAGTDLPVDEGTATAVAAIAPVKGQITAGPRHGGSTEPHPARPTSLAFSTVNIAGLKHPQTIEELLTSLVLQTIRTVEAAAVTAVPVRRLAVAAAPPLIAQASSGPAAVPSQGEPQAAPSAAAPPRQLASAPP